MSASDQKGQYQLNVQFPLLPETLSPQFQKDFPSYIEGFTQSVPGNYFTSPVYARKAQEFYNLKPRQDDVYVLTFPKSGSTWVQDLVWLVVNDCDFETATNTSLTVRSPFLEMNYLVPKALYEKYERDAMVKKTGSPWMGKIMDALNYFNLMDLVVRPVMKSFMSFLLGERMYDLSELSSLPSPRIFKSHLPFYLLHPELLETSKVVYVARNPKDVIVSYYHYHRLMDHHKYTGDLETFAEYFITDKVYSAPFFPHLLDAWSKRNHPNMLFLFYEDLKRDLCGEIQKVARFFGKMLTVDQLNRMVDHLRVDKFSQNKAVNYENYKQLGFMNQSGHFVRKGKTGDWKNHFSPELNKRIDEWIASNLKGSDLTFITELDQQD